MGLFALIVALRAESERLDRLIATIERQKQALLDQERLRITRRRCSGPRGKYGLRNAQRDQLLKLREHE